MHPLIDSHINICKPQNKCHSTAISGGLDSQFVNKSRSHCHSLQTLRLECADSYVRPDCQYTSVSSPLLGLVDCCYTALHRQTSPDHSPRCSQSYAPSENRVSLLDNLIRCVLRTALLNYLKNINSNSNNVNFYLMQTKTLCFVLLKTFL